MSNQDLHHTTEPGAQFNQAPNTLGPKGYPSFKLVLESQIDDRPLPNLPDGPWCTDTKPLPTESEQLRLIDQGYLLDSKGRPLHPNLKELLLPESGGVVTGKGVFHHWGPNRTGDAVVVTEEASPKIALVRRRDNGKWAVPGGFIDPADGRDPVEAGKRASAREAFEEVGLDLFNIVGTLVCQIVVEDFRATAHAWPETTAVLYRIPVAERLIPDLKEVKSATWFPIDEIPESLHGSHRYLIDEALRLL